MMQIGETPYAIAEKKGYDEVCEELLPPELKKQPEVRSDSARHKVAVSFTSDTVGVTITHYFLFFFRVQETFRVITKGIRAALFGTVS